MRRAIFCALLLGCSSSHAGPADAGGGGLFGSGSDASDTGSGSGGGGHHTTGGHDAGSSHDAAPVKGDAGGMPKMGACGSPSGSDWCNTNAPVISENSNLECDDFDDGVRSSAYTWSAGTANSLVGNSYVSPFCSFAPAISPDAGVMAAQAGAFTEHAYNGLTGGAATLAFDLFVAGGSSCEGATVAYFVTLFPTAPTGALEVWLSISGISGSGYTVTATAQSGGSPENPDSGTLAPPVSITVMPSAADKSWARVELALSAFALNDTPTATTASGNLSWFHIGSKTTVSHSSPFTVSGQVGGSGQAETLFDLGLLPSPSTRSALAGCQLYFDDFVSNVVTSP